MVGRFYKCWFEIKIVVFLVYKYVWENLFKFLFVLYFFLFGLVSRIKVATGGSLVRLLGCFLYLEYK